MWERTKKTDAIFQDVPKKIICIHFWHAEILWFIYKALFKKALASLATGRLCTRTRKNKLVSLNDPLISRWCPSTDGTARRLHWSTLFRNMFPFREIFYTTHKSARPVGVFSAAVDRSRITIDTYPYISLQSRTFRVRVPLSFFPLPRSPWFVFHLRHLALSHHQREGFRMGEIVGIMRIEVRVTSIAVCRGCGDVSVTVNWAVGSGLLAERRGCLKRHRTCRRGGGRAVGRTRRRCGRGARGSLRNRDQSWYRARWTRCRGRRRRRRDWGCFCARRKHQSDVTVR